MWLLKALNNIQKRRDGIVEQWKEMVNTLSFCFLLTVFQVPWCPLWFSLCFSVAHSFFFFYCSHSYFISYSHTWTHVTWSCDQWVHHKMYTQTWFLDPSFPRLCLLDFASLFPFNIHVHTLTYAQLTHTHTIMTHQQSSTGQKTQTVVCRICTEIFLFLMLLLFNKGWITTHLVARVSLLVYALNNYHWDGSVGSLL